MKKKSKLLILLITVLSPLFSYSQSPNLNFFGTNFIFSNIYTGVLDSLRYFPGLSEPDPAWYTTGYDDSSWDKNVGIIGYGYGSDGSVQIDPAAKSLYARLSFTIKDKTKIKELNFCPDYDDGYVAYFNGVEIARVNVEKTVQFPPYNAVATRSHASEFIRDSLITSPVLGIYLDSAFLASNLVNGENIIAVQVINDSKGDDLMFFPVLMDISNTQKQPVRFSDAADTYFLRFDARCKRLIDIDSTDLPLIIIETDQNGIPFDQRTWTTVHMGIIDNGEGNYNKPTDPFNNYNGLISIRQRGQSSRDFAKKSYRFETVDENLADTSFALLGLPKESDWVLFGPFTDKSQVRNKLAYDLAARTGHYAPRTRFCELIINGQLEGLYILTEQVKRDKNRVDISKLKETDISGVDVTGGYIFMYEKNDVFPRKDIRIKGRKVVYPDAPALEQQNYLKQFLNTYDSILIKTNDFLDPVKGFRKYASDTSLVDYFIINEIAKNADAYTVSTYMYKDRDDKDGRIKFGPIWDCDIAFGNSVFQNGNLTTGWQFEFNNFPMNCTRYFQDTKFVELFQKRWKELRSKTYCNDSIFGFLDELLELVRPARERNYEVWPVIDHDIFYEGYYANSYENEIYLMKDWITKRLEWIDNNVDKIYYPLKRVGNENLNSVAGNMNIRIYPNPFESEISVSLNMDEESDVRIELYSMTGQLQHQISRENVSGYVDFLWNDSNLSAMKSGMYVAKVYVNGTPCQSLKIIKK
jgi:hypothetical protein